MFHTFFSRLGYRLQLVVGLLVSGCHFTPAPAHLLTQNARLDRKLQQLIQLDVDAISPDELADWPTDSYVLLDTREREEYAVSHLPGADWLGFANPQWEVLENLAPTDRIVLYCSVGYRSERIGKALQSRGFTQVYNLYGSIFAWAQQGYPLVDTAGQPTRRIHTYNEKWGQLLPADTLERVWR